jgi:hypothetical protein
MRWMRKRDNSPVVTVGSRAWLESLRAGAQERIVAEHTSVVPEEMRQFTRTIGRRGGLQRSRNYARRNFHKGVRFWQRYGSNPNKVAATPVKASPEQLRYLRIYASRGGTARAARLNREERAAIAAKGGRAKAEKAAKLKQVALCASAVAGKQE